MALRGLSALSLFALTSAMAVAQPAGTRPWMDSRLGPEARARLLVGQMTLDEQIGLVHGPYAWPFNNAKIPAEAIGSSGFIAGNARLGIPALQETDGSLGVTNPSGFRAGLHPERGGTPLPSALMLASTFDPSLAYRSGVMVGSEAHAKGYNLVLAGAVNLARDPRAGRNFEYLGEDPLLAGIMGGQLISGIQSQHVVSTIKHYALNGQDTGRLYANSVIEEAALRESDLLAFEIGIETGHPGSVMCAYNMVNGIYSCSNDHLLNGILKGDWGYHGWVMSDWGAVHATDDVVKGLDQESGEQLDPEVFLGAPLKAAIEQGRIPRRRLDDMNYRMLGAMFENGVFDDPARVQPINYEANAQVARAVAQDGIVLLKNEAGLLPLLSKAGKIAVIGGHAEKGVLSGGGSSQVTEPDMKDTVVTIGGEGRSGPWRSMVFHASSPIAAIRGHAPKAEVTFDDGRYNAAAAALAARSDIAIVFATQWMSEGEDVPDLSLPDDQNALISAVAAANPRTIVVLETGGPVDMPWLHQVPAVLEAWYSGAKGGDAIADILFGTVNPSGRLPMTFPISIEQYPRLQTPGLGVPPKTRFDVPYAEGADVGYRRFAKAGLTPRFPFGYGLSYTHFRYAGLEVRGGPGVKVDFVVTNSGKAAGKDAPQIYLVRRGETAMRRLVGFSKMALTPGETRHVSYMVDNRLLADFDPVRHRWVRPAARYVFALSHSAEQDEQSVAVNLPAQKLKP